MARTITSGNIADVRVLEAITLLLAGKRYADKDIIGRDLFVQLRQGSLHRITGIRRNTCNYLMLLADKLLLRKRSLIETVLDIPKSEMGLEHSVTAQW